MPEGRRSPRKSAKGVTYAEPTAINAEEEEEQQSYEDEEPDAGSASASEVEEQGASASPFRKRGRPSKGGRTSMAKGSSKNDDEDGGGSGAVGPDEPGEPEEIVKFDGDKYLDKDGNPSEGKELRMKSFLLPDRHETRQYALILDLARVTGIGDSFRFFKAHPTLPKTYLLRFERERLVDEGLVHPIMKFRNVPIISVVAAYKRFGTKILRSKKSERAETGMVGLVRDHRLAVAELSADYDRVASRRSLANNSSQELLLRRNEEGIALLKDLKPAPPPDAEGVDWIYQCALSAAGFNAQIAVERQSRLWGPILPDTPDDISSEDSALTDSEDEEHMRRKAEKAKRRRERANRPVDYRKGYFDVHTNMNQVPASTQYVNLRLETDGLTLQGIKRRLKDADDRFAKKTVSVIMDPSDHLAPRRHLNCGAALSAVFGPGFRPSEEDQGKYPLAVLPGQYQSLQSVFQKRFGQPHITSDTKPLKPVPQMLPPPPQATGLQQHFPPNFQQQPWQSFRKPTNDFSFAAAASASTVCGSLTPNGPCRQKVPKEGDRCFAHRAVAGAASSSGADNPFSANVGLPKHLRQQDDGQSERTETPDISEAVVCNICENDILAKLKEPLTAVYVKDLVANNSVQCATCFHFYHVRCLEHCTPTMEAKMRTYGWQCNDCKLCSVCKEIGKEDELVLCDDCDRSYHLDCMDPPLKNLPAGKWLCDECAVCGSCNTEFGHDGAQHLSEIVASAASKGKKDTYLTTLCKDCQVKFDHDQFCVVCLKTFSDFELKSSPKKERRSLQKSAVSNEPELCTSCDRRVHYACDERVGSNREEPENYKCPVCRALDRPTVDSDDESTKRKLEIPGGKIRRRGRPRKYPLQVIPTVEELRDRKTIRKRNVVPFRKSHVVAPITKMII